jgi:hypothetical protein
MRPILIPLIKGTALWRSTPDLEEEEDAGGRGEEKD